VLETDNRINFGKSDVVVFLFSYKKSTFPLCRLRRKLRVEDAKRKKRGQLENHGTFNPGSAAHRNVCGEG